MIGQKIADDNRGKEQGREVEKGFEEEFNLGDGTTVKGKVVTVGLWRGVHLDLPLLQVCRKHHSSF